MHARHGQGGNVHGDTAVQVEGANEEEEPPDNYRPANGQYQAQWLMKTSLQIHQILKNP